MSDRAFQYADRNLDSEIDDETPDELVAGERISAPPPRGRRSTMLSAAVVVLVISGASWTIIQYQPALERLSTVARSAMRLATAQFAPAAEQTAESPPSRIADAPPQVEKLAAVEVATPEAATIGEPAPAETIAAPPSEVAPDEASSAPLPKPVIDPNDADQKRAVAAGLHPSLSKSLLKRMTATDYRNAERAIKTALAETPDGETYAWPESAASKVARFEVHFVAGAPADCRRYIVVVTKDRWSTTARPMETCGVKAAGKRAASALRDG